MNSVESYIEEVLGTGVERRTAGKEIVDKVPFYIKQSFNFDWIGINNHTILLAEAKAPASLTPGQYEKQMQLLSGILQQTPVLILNNLSPGDRKRLIQKGINFIEPGKQLFLPDLLIDLRDYPMRKRQKPEREKLLPSAQLILLYKILNRTEDISRYTFKELANKFHYTQMAITKAVDNLRYHELCTVTGTKERYLHFEKPITELWHDAGPLLVNPVLKTVFTDVLPPGIYPLKSNASALAEYTDMVPSRQHYVAIEKNQFYSLEKEGTLNNLHDREGRYCLEVWKYNPALLITNQTEESSVDPLSLYLSLRETKDERIEMALDQILEKVIW